MTFFFFIFVFCEPEFSSCDEFGLRSSNTGGVADNDEATSSRVEGVLFSLSSFFFIWEVSLDVFTAELEIVKSDTDPWSTTVLFAIIAFPEVEVARL